MIFKTFDSNIDKWTSKIGIFGKSFNELGTAVNNAFKSAIDNIDNFDENVGFWESLKNNLFSKKDKDWIKNSLGEIISKENIDSYIVELDLDSAKEKLTDIFDWEGLVNQNKKTWQDYFGTLDDGEKYIVDLIKNTDDLSKLTGEDLVKANQQARDSALAHNEAIKAQTLSAKAGTVALKALSIAGNMIVMWGISKVISIVTSTWDNFNVTVKEVQENVDELTSNIKSLNAELDELKGKDSLTDAEQGRLKYLETRVDLEERLLKIEQTRLAQEKLGKSSKITDWFDDDSYVKKATKEFGALALDSSFLTNPGFNPLPFAFINGFNAYNNGAEAVIREGNEQYEELKNLNEKYEQLVEERDKFNVGSDEWKIKDEDVTQIAKKLETYQKTVVSGSYADLLEKYGQYTKQVENLENILSNSEFLTDDEIAQNQRLLNLYSSSADIIKELINNIAIALGDQSLWLGDQSPWISPDLELLDSKTDRLTADTIQRYFTDEEIEILAHLDFDRNASINTLRSLLKEEQAIADDEPMTFSSAISDESLSKFQSTIDSLKSSLTTLYNGDYSSTDC